MFNDSYVQSNLQTFKLYQLYNEIVYSVKIILLKDMKYSVVR
jgi:hypothetical protein